MGTGLKKYADDSIKERSWIKKYVGNLLPSLSLNTQYIEPSRGEAKKAFIFQIKPTSYGRSRNLDCVQGTSLLESLEVVWWGYRVHLNFSNVWAQSASPKDPQTLVALEMGQQLTS